MSAISNSLPPLTDLPARPGQPNMKTELSLDIPDGSVRVRSPDHLEDCIFLTFAPDSGVCVEKLLRPDGARRLAAHLLAAADHAELPRSLASAEAMAVYHRAQASVMEALVSLTAVPDPCVASDDETPVAVDLGDGVIVKDTPSRLREIGVLE